LRLRGELRLLLLRRFVRLRRLRLLLLRLPALWRLHLRLLRRLQCALQLLHRAKLWWMWWLRRMWLRELRLRLWMRIVVRLRIVVRMSMRR
jgi:hypothetical protein